MHSPSPDAARPDALTALTLCPRALLATPPDDPHAVLATIAANLVATVPGASGASVVARRHGAIEPAVVATDDATRRLELLQIELVEGPAVDTLAALETGAVLDPALPAPDAILVADLASPTAQERWPTWHRHLAEHGPQGCSPCRWPSATSPTLAVRGVHHADAAARQAHARQAIDRATGILAERHAIPTDQALARLTAAATRTRQPLAAIAAQITNEQ